MNGKNISPIELSNYTISDDNAPFVVAELSGNHNNSLDLALRLVEEAADAGADAFKLQTYTADTMTIDCHEPDFLVTGTGEKWEQRSLYDLYSEASTPWEWHKPLYDKCKELGMIPFSTPFDETAVDFLESLDNEIYKIASFELTDIPLIKKVAATQKLIIMSTGMATEQEIARAVHAIKKEGNSKFILLKCTSAYPAKLGDANLSTIPYFREKFGCYVGLSDHTLGATSPTVATALGARVIEKHLCLDGQEGVDSHFSMRPSEFKQMVNAVKQSFETLGTIQTAPSKSEISSRNYRRSIYVTKDIKAGEPFTSENIRVIRPGFGLAPQHYQTILGERSKADIKRGTALSLSHVDAVKSQFNLEAVDLCMKSSRHSNEV